MNDTQIFASDVVELIPDGALWIFEANEDLGDNMPGITCGKNKQGEWCATIGSEERLWFLEQLQWEDEDSYWMFGGAWHMSIEFEGQLILRSWDLMSMVEFSKDFSIPAAFKQKYFGDCAGYATDW